MLAHEDQDKKEDIQYKEYPYRFVILGAYLLASLVNSLPINTFAATTTIVEKTFHISSPLITLNFLIYPISHTIAATPINWMLAKKGIRPSYYVAAVLMSAGVWLRTTLSTENPYVCLLGSLISGAGGLFIFNSASKIIQNWFRADVATIATFLSVFSSFISNSTGLFLPGLVLDSQSTAEDFLAFLRLQALLVSVPFLLLVVVIREKPPTPPSRAAEAEHQNNLDTKYRVNLQNLFKNKNYLKLAVSMSLTFGVITAHLSIIDRGLKALGFNEPAQIISYLVIAAAAAGLFGNYFYSQLLRRTKKYKLLSIVITIGFTIGYLVLLTGEFCGVSSSWGVGLVSILFGFHYYSQPSFFIIYGAQLAFPVDQSSVAGFLIAIAQLFGFALGLLLVALIDGSRSNIIVLFLAQAVLMLLGVAVAASIGEDLRKDRFEEDKKDGILYTSTPEEDHSTSVLSSQEAQLHAPIVSNSSDS